eukprot:jgi/Astpho2/6251/Aster-x1360
MRTSAHPGQRFEVQSFGHPLRGALGDPDLVLKGLIGANVAGFVMWQINPKFMANHFLVSLQHLKAGRVYTLITAAFSQKDMYHLLGNLFSLYFFGRQLGMLFGGRTLLGLYLAGGLAGSMSHVLWYWWKARNLPRSPWGGPSWAAQSPAALGASGAVNAIVVGTFRELEADRTALAM